MNVISLKISGDYVNSFIYSGLLFLVKNGGEVVQIDWPKLIEKKVKNSSLRKFINNCQEAIKEDFEDFSLSFEKQDFNDCILDSTSLDFWPNDFIIYSNILYFSGQCGVEAIGLDFHNKKFLKETRKYIFNDRSYKLSSSKNRGIAIAAGVNGVVLKSINKFMQETVRPEILEEVSVDIEWGSSSLVVNSEFGSKINFFKKIPDVDYHRLSTPEKNDFNEAKIKKFASDVMPGYSWSIGNRIFNLNEDTFKRSNVNTDDITDSNEAEGGIFGIKSVEIKSGKCNLDNFDSARSASFGCIVDLYDKIFLLNDFGFQEIGVNLSKWKVFPRAKNYVNHLHMIEDDFLHVKIFARKQMISRKFGIAPSSIDA